LSAAALLVGDRHIPSQLCTSPSHLGLVKLSMTSVPRATVHTHQLRLPPVACLRSRRILVWLSSVAKLGRRTMSTDLICAVESQVSCRVRNVSEAGHLRSGLSLLSVDAMISS
jgi:hypothetical protein